MQNRFIITEQKKENRENVLVVIKMQTGGVITDSVTCVQKEVYMVYI